jgi:hypothetical protein
MNFAPSDEALNVLGTPTPEEAAEMAAFVNGINAVTAEGVDKAALWLVSAIAIVGALGVVAQYLPVWGVR